MARAIRCDRCGMIYDKRVYQKYHVMKNVECVNSRGSLANRYELDLCKKCGEELEEFMGPYSISDVHETMSEEGEEDGQSKEIM